MSGIERLGNLSKAAELGSEFKGTNYLSLPLTDGFPDLGHWALMLKPGQSQAN